MTPAPCWTACSNASPVFPRRSFLLITNLNFPGTTWCHYLLSYQPTRISYQNICISFLGFLLVCYIHYLINLKSCLFFPMVFLSHPQPCPPCHCLCYETSAPCICSSNGITPLWIYWLCKVHAPLGLACGTDLLSQCGVVGACDILPGTWHRCAVDETRDISAGAQWACHAVVSASGDCRDFKSFMFSI